MPDRYDADGNTEAQYQSDSNNKVLLNKLGITDAKEMDDVELDLLEQLYGDVLDRVALDQMLTVADISEWHRKWLGNVYEWAGRERSVNMGKGDFQFAVAGQIPRLLKVLDKDFLSVYTPCEQMNDEQLIEAITIVHIEFILVHPFREGNGRLSRLLASVMALQANKPELDFSVLDEKREAYFAAIQIGMDRNYEPLKVLVKQVLRDSEQGAYE